MMPLNPIEQKVMERCDALLEDTLVLTEHLVREYSVLGQEQRALGVMEAWLESEGLPVERVGLDDGSLLVHPGYAPVSWSGVGRYSVVSRLNPESNKPHLVFNGHVDVVPAEPVDSWTQLPWEPWRKGGWLYGRGAGDMKAGVAAMSMAVKAVRDAGHPMDYPFTLQAVIEEECSGNGALACVSRGYQGDFVLIPEPFGARIYTGQVGVVRFKIEVEGTPAHVLDTSAGCDAIEAMQQLFPALKALQEALNEERQPPYDALEHPFNLNIGRFDGGNWASSVAAHAVIEGRIGFDPSTSPHSVMERLERAILQAHTKLALPVKPPRVSFHGFRSEGHLVDLEHPGIALLSGCHESLTQQRPRHYLSTCTTDLRAFHQAGVPGTCYGPIADAIHGVDERVNIESIRQTLKAYALFMCRWGRQPH
ncbi:ArgE/DapE family deacylase [Vreelandella olivaria]|uniref:ArgE/DapE family deacylase n=1 Tax=Vreelandella olivaria TaxID=390919 RepID=UPI00201EA712|nr:ArgE/DapE family deacylase [Halomonas olivaria]